MKALATSVASFIVAALCAFGTIRSIEQFQAADTSADQLTCLVVAGCAALGSISALWLFVSYAALAYATLAPALRLEPRSRFTNPSPLLRFAAVFGTPAVRRSLAIIGVMSATALPASADTGATDLGWGAPVAPERGSAPAVVAINTHTVQPGDSLWSIAANSLEPDATQSDIAAESARWLQANPESIADPNLIFPGQVLNAPLSSQDYS
ncbi:MAG: LysM peptidoglycan-binding domain-containing protein [Ancrocorticia sp.]|uniref:LysM peptidoglycan-binding domain-containing protein n=1 Tax=Ancrocorticia sp. TaxID=2593684 RepID=UPI003F8E4930